MAAAGRFEAQITGQSANATGTINYNGAGAVVWTVTASATRYPLTAVSAWATALTTAAGSTITASWSRSHGRITLSAAASFVVAFTTTEWRDLMGATGTLTGASSYDLPAAVQGAWLPNVPFASGNNDDFDLDSTGVYEDDSSYNEGPSGNTTIWLGNSKRAYENVSVVAVERARAIDGADSTVISYQEWVRESQRGGLTYFAPATDGTYPKTKVYVDSANDTLLGAADGGDGIYRLILPRRLNLVRPSEGWAGLHTVTIPRMVKT